MARYIEAVKCAEIISERMGIPLGDLVDVFADIPSADVVPKSEVEQWVRECEELQGRLIELEKEVAKEIFEGIDYFVTLYKEGHFSEKSLLECIADLKKKYTESENKG